MSSKRLISPLPAACAAILVALALASCRAAPDRVAGGNAGASAGAEGENPGTPETAPERPPTLALDTPDGAYPVVWVRKGEKVEVRTEPGGGELVEVADRRTEFGSPTVFSVVKKVGRWAAIPSPKLANGRLGWIKLDPARLDAGWTKVAIEVDVSQRNAALIEDGKAVKSFPITVGASGYDTPLGRFAVTDTFRGDLDQTAYGCCALALSATQPNVPSGWLGGNRIAIHGTSGPLGVAASHGCVRAANREVDELVDRVPLGAPVFIRA